MKAPKEMPEPGKIPTYDELKKLTYLNACVKEMLRLIPIVPFIERVVAEDDNILGYDIPKGTHVVISPAVLHKLKSVYGDDAEEYVPERWIDPSTMADDSKINTKYVTPDMNWAYSPFMTGPRNCIGSKIRIN
jgi:cytochrome P450